MTCPYTSDIAAYLLDALEPAEAQQLREHLVGCEDCLPEYQQLRELPTMLHRLSASDVDEMAAPADLPETLFDGLLARAAARRERHTRRRVLGLAAAVAAAGVGVVTGVSLPRDHTPTPVSATVAATDPNTKVRASIVLTGQTWGTQIRLRLSGVRWAQQCMLVVTAADGRRDVAASWIATYRGSLGITGTTAIPLQQIRHLDVITSKGQRLVCVPPPAH
ncbi:MAG TPA: zf-HC2 domain-containing protein [Pseudonocardiaceae bacterium]|nr:zf-HC2 domain-containing protein [Pseudonocardiaceae bacterium]